MDNKSIWLFLGAGLLVLIFCLIGLDTALKPLLFAWVLSYFCLPIFEKLEAIGIKRHYSAFVILLFILLIILSVLFIFIPNLVSELQFFLEDFPQFVVGVAKNLVSIASSKGFNFDLDDFSLLSFIKSHMPNISAKSLVWVGSAFQSALSNIIYTVLSIISIFLFPVFFFYVSISHREINKVISSWLPARYNNMFTTIEDAIDDVMGGFLRGQIVISTILACYYSFSLSIIGLNFAIVIGICTGLLSLIPYVGFSLGLFSSLIVAFAIAFALKNAKDLAKAIFTA